ncbi:dihydrofolate reductase family protein [Amycolatopsis thermoflava]|uniref:dihydrofolate reductase family protein n=1 Tax=Amycolatopsis thermoflava TaxID=84480 RepID=UPI0004871312|nr:dihydrofolate reductase family protein [Amycolatopsis thermoflava]
MTRIVYYTSTSLDGYLADAENSLDWLFAVEGGAEAIAEGDAFVSGVTVLVEGSTTYRWLVEHEDLLAHPDKWQTFYGDRKTFVFTTRDDLPVVPGADVEFVSGPVSDHIDHILAAAGGGDVWVVGGGALAAAFAAIGKLDEIHLSIAPVTLTAGAPLLPAALNSSRLRLVEVHKTGQFIKAKYSLTPARHPTGGQ